MSTTRDNLAHDIRGVLIHVEGDSLLLPNAAVAEVLSFSAPDPVAGAPDCCSAASAGAAGRCRWWRSRAWPASPTNRRPGQQGGGVEGARREPKAPYFAVLTRGFPRLVTVPRDELLQHDDGEPLPTACAGAVTLREDSALVPDLARIEARIQEGLQQAA